MKKIFVTLAVAGGLAFAFSGSASAHDRYYYGYQPYYATPHAYVYVAPRYPRRIVRHYYPPPYYAYYAPRPHFQFRYRSSGVRVGFGW